MITINLTNPNLPPVDGDLIEINHANGAVERKMFCAPPTAPTAAQARKAAIVARLCQLDELYTDCNNSVRTAREIAQGGAIAAAAQAFKAAKIAALDAETATLRAELVKLP